MNAISYIKRNGVKGTFQVIRQYKIDRIIRKVILPFVARKPLDNTIIIESHNDFDCNGGAFYQFLIENGYNNTYKIVWLLKHPENKPETLPENVECYPLYSPSIKKDLRICTAKYLLADCVVTGKMRKEQLSIVCMHGSFSLKCPQKYIKLPNSVDYLISPSDNVDDIVVKIWGADNSSTKLIHIGYPSEDVFYNMIQDELSAIKREKYQKTILWMPTFRKLKDSDRNDGMVDQPYGIPMIKSDSELDMLNDFLREHCILLVIKIHPMQDLETVKALHGRSNIVILTGDDIKRYGIDNFAMIASADAMISDYSSSAYVYLHKDRPIGIMLNDLHDYKLQLIVDDPDPYIPGMKIMNFNDFMKFIDDVAKGKDPFKEKRHQVFDYVYQYHDGNSCKRLAELMQLGG